MNGAGTIGAYAEGGGRIHLGNNITIKRASTDVFGSATTTDSYGIMAMNSYSQIDVGKNVTIETKGSGSMGILAAGRAVVLMDEGATITSSGTNYSAGVWAEYNSQITLQKDFTITTTQTDSIGIFSADTSVVTLYGGEISSPNIALYAVALGEIIGTGVFDIAGALYVDGAGSGGTIDLTMNSGSVFTGFAEDGGGAVNNAALNLQMTGTTWKYYRRFNSNKPWTRYGFGN